MQISTPYDSGLCTYKVLGGPSRGILHAASKESGRSALDLGRIGPSVLCRGRCDAAFPHSLTLEPSADIRTIRHVLSERWTRLMEFHKCSSSIM